MLKLSEIQKMIDEEVSAIMSDPQPSLEPTITTAPVANENIEQQQSVSSANEMMTEPQDNLPKRVVYRPVLKTEEEINNALFYGDRKPDYE